jgi:hypothetical protein
LGRAFEPLSQPVRELISFYREAEQARVRTGSGNPRHPPALSSCKLRQGRSAYEVHRRQ